MEARMAPPGLVESTIRHGTSSIYTCSGSPWATAAPAWTFPPIVTKFAPLTNDTVVTQYSGLPPDAGTCVQLAFVMSLAPDMTQPPMLSVAPWNVVPSDRKRA